MSPAHTDRFAQEHLPPLHQWPEFLFERPELQFPAQLNCAAALLDARVTAGEGARTCILAEGGLRWTYADLQDRADRIAHVLVREMGLQPGNRVLLSAPNNPMLAACWFGVVKAGGIVVATMPLLRAAELVPIIQKARISHALCDLRLAPELQKALAACPTLLRCGYFESQGRLDEAHAANQTASQTANQAANQAAGQTANALAEVTPPALPRLEPAMARQGLPFTAVDTAAEETCLLAFTSGTTGVPKATMHFHRDVMAACACWPRHVLKPQADDIFIGSPPLAFTFGLGGLLLFPMAVGAATVLLEKASPELLAQATLQYGATVMVTAPTSYRAMAAQGAALKASALRRCISAGEALPAATRSLWREATGIELIDGIGATELLHIFISADEAHARSGATGQVVPGYRACILGDDGQPLPPGQVGRLAVKGPTGCRYLDDARQTHYVQNGWNLTGDAYLMDADGYFHFQARTDDMIVSAGYNIAAPEVENALLAHPWVAECAVIGAPDEQRGQIVKAFVVLRQPVPGSPPDLPPALAQDEATITLALQDFVKASIAPYKYPRAIRFVDALPRTGTGKLQRFRLRDVI